MIQRHLSVQVTSTVFGGRGMMCYHFGDNKILKMFLLALIVWTRVPTCMTCQCADNMFRCLTLHIPLFHKGSEERAELGTAKLNP